MKTENGPTITYGQYDEPRSFKRIFWNGITLILVCACCAWFGLNGSMHLERAAIGEVEHTKKVIVKQKKGQTTTITQENRQWLDNVVSEVK